MALLILSVLARNQKKFRLIWLEHELKQIEKCVHSKLSYWKVACEGMPKRGDQVRVKSGQFAGIDAIFQEQDGEKRSIMLVQMITKRVPVSIDNNDLDLK